MSYSVHLVHGPSLQTLILLGLFRDTLPFLAGVIGAVLGLAFITARVVERPGNAYGRRLASRLGRRTPDCAQRGLSGTRVTQVHSVLMLNDFWHVQGGASRAAIDEAVALRKFGLDVTFLGAVRPVCDALDAAGVRTICLDQPEQLTATNRLACRFEFRCIARAASSLPVPLSPVISTGSSVLAYRPSISVTCRIAALEPTMSDLPSVGVGCSGAAPSPFTSEMVACRRLRRLWSSAAHSSRRRAKRSTGTRERSPSVTGQFDALN